MKQSKVQDNGIYEVAFTDNDAEEHEQNDFSDIDVLPPISGAYENIENGRYTPGTVGGIVMDISGIAGGTHTRIYDALQQNGVVFVPEKLHDEYQDVLRRYYGKPRKTSFGFKYTKI